MTTDTIAAIATAWGEAGIAIVRLSGPSAVELGQSALRFEAGRGFPPPRVMRLATLTDEAERDIDQVLAVRFVAPKSYTGEDVVEIHTHGGTLVARICLEGLIRRGARMAEPGEFTKRAFLNGRIDLSQAEGVLGIIRSRSSEALRAAARTLSGELSAFASDVRDELLTLQSSLEVGLDFPEESVPYVSDEDLPGTISTLKLSLEDLRDRCSVGLLLREGIRVALTGRPNVGKSSLLNALLKQARAIVTALPGTTRDVIEEAITWQGVPIRLVDTAGLRAPSDEIEASGIARANEELRRADIRLWILDGSGPMEDEDQEYIGRLGERHIVVLNKADLPHAITEDDIRAISPASPVLSLSAKTGEGLDPLKEQILSMASGSGALDAGLNVTARQLSEIRDALASVTEAETAALERTGQDVVATLLATARECLERLLGLDCDDALLDSVFSRFCVGK
ncbi:MAG: tRNA uridine-5-carboxymethylaminomethyl(34) synthesis GTPase MnmE [Synergistaceae bacterium]|jgi:tRNA modification GTPase|nr:tRNA uridine-5-carboxymethylaminomethyl(34) synthesis GTPase MnmE [Synergistaceae bacterium]